MKPFYTPIEIAEMLQISYNKVLNEILLGNLSAIKIGRHYRISEYDLKDYLKKCKYAAYKWK